MITPWQMSAGLSATLRTVTKWCILQQKCLNK